METFPKESLLPVEETVFLYSFLYFRAWRSFGYFLLGFIKVRTNSLPVSNDFFNTWKLIEKTISWKTGKKSLNKYISPTSSQNIEFGYTRLHFLGFTNLSRRYSASLEILSVTRKTLFKTQVSEKRAKFQWKNYLAQVFSYHRVWQTSGNIFLNLTK